MSDIDDSDYIYAGFGEDDGVDEQEDVVDDSAYEAAFPERKGRVVNRFSSESIFYSQKMDDYLIGEDGDEEL